jgi:hypothetical protein
LAGEAHEKFGLGHRYPLPLHGASTGVCGRFYILYQWVRHAPSRTTELICGIEL